MISGKCPPPATKGIKERKPTETITMDHFRLYDMSEPHSDIGVSLWGPGQALFKTNMATVSFVDVQMNNSQMISIASCKTL